MNAALGRKADPSELIASHEQQEKTRAEIAAIISGKTRDEWEAIFAGTDACVEPVLAPEELPKHPQHVARGMFFQLGDLTQMRTPFGRADGHTAPPQLGEHTATILSEAGFSEADIASLTSNLRR
jgi:alpha-methylacyl-CoA racemase